MGSRLHRHGSPRPPAPYQPTPHRAAAPSSRGAAPFLSESRLRRAQRAQRALPARRCGRGRGRAQLCLLHSYLSHAGRSSGCRVPRGCRCRGTATHIVLLRLQRGTFNGYFREATAPNGAFLFSARAALGSDGFFLSPPCCTAPLIARTVLLSCTRQKASPPPSQRAARCCFPGWPGSLHDGELFVNKAMCAGRSHGAVQQGCAPGSYLLSPYLCVQQSWAASREHFQEQQFSPPRAVPHSCQLQSLPSHSALLLPGSVTLKGESPREAPRVIHSGQSAAAC